MVDVDEVIAYMAGDPQKDTVDELFDFGKLLLDQIRGLRASYDAKLTSCLGWGTAILAVMLAGFTNWSNHGPSGVLAGLGASSAFLSVLASVFGFKSVAGWKWPSEKDWFAFEYFDWPERLKRQYVIAMLEAHQSYSKRTQRKGYALMAAEYLLGLSAVLFAVAVLMRQLGM